MAKSEELEEAEILAIDETAKRLGVTDRTLRNWMAEKEMPSISAPRGRRFVWLEVLTWYVQMKVEEDGNFGKRSGPGDGSEDSLLVKLDRAKLRASLADADLKELELAERRAQVVAIEDATRSLQDVAKTLQVEILGWPTVMVGRIFGVRDRTQLLGLLTSSARELCTRLATIAPEPTPDA